MKTAKLEKLIKFKKQWEVEGIEWREVKLEKIIIEKPRYGLTAKSKNKGKYLYLRITDINNKGKINDDSFKFVDIDKKEKSKYEIKKGDLLLARSGSVGNFFIADKDYPDWVYASYLIRFRLDSTKILPAFIKYILISGRFQRWVEYRKRIGAQPNINAKEFSNFKIPIPFRNGKPDLETQKKIVEYIETNFSKIDKILEKKKEALKQLDELWESALEQAFKPKDGEEWREVMLGDRNFFHIETGATPKTPIKKYWKNGTIKWATPKDLGRKIGRYLLDTERKISKDGLDSCSTTLIPKGSILISTRAPIGHISILGDDMCFNQGCKGLVIKSNQIVSEFVYYELLTKIEFMKTLGSGPTFEELSKNKVATIKIPLPFRNNQPDLEKQKEIANYLDSVYEKIQILKEKKQKQIIQLGEMRESILDEAFNHSELVP